jgi:hypothetical protein
MVVRISIYVVAALLIAAHFLRDGNWLGVAICLAAPLLFIARRRWSLQLLEGLAYVAAIVWLWTAWELAMERSALGQPWLRASLILGVVAAVSALAGGLLRSKAMQLRYRDR